MKTKFRRFRWAVGLVVIWSAASAYSQLPVIELSALSRSAARVGSEFNLKISAGSRLDEVRELRFSHPGITARLLDSDPLPFSEKRVSRFGEFQIKVADDVPVGRYDVRAVGRHGVSNPRMFVIHAFSKANVDTSPTSLSLERETPTRLTIGTPRLANATARASHYFAFSVKDGSSLQIDCLASFLGSRMIPTLRVFSATGQTTHRRTGSEAIDPRVIINDPGDYVLAVHDAIYRGGEGFGYFLIAQHARSAIHVADVQPALPGQIPSVATLNALGIGIVGQELPMIEESESSIPITVPKRFRAKLDSAGDRDYYEFSAREGDKYAIDVVSQRLNYPTDCRLILEQAEPQTDGSTKWHQVVTDDDSQEVGDVALRCWTSDPFAMLTIPATGTYRLTIQDLDLGTSLRINQEYVCEIREPKPDFELIAYRPFPAKDELTGHQFGSQLMRAGTQAVRVFCLRRDGWTGPVELRIEGLPPGVTCAPATIAANQTHTQLTLVAADDAAASVTGIRVLGRALVGDASREHVAAAAAIQYGKGQLRNYLRSRLANQLMISVSDEHVQPVELAVGDGNLIEIKKGQAAKLKAKLVRHPGGKQNCVLRPRDFPPKVSCAEITITADKSDGEVELKVAADAPSGTYSLWWQVETKIKMKLNPQKLVRAEAYVERLQKLHKDSDAEKRQSIAAAIKAAEVRVKAATEFAKDQEFLTFLPTPHVTIKIVDP